MCWAMVQSAALTNEYERERASLASADAALNRQTIEVRRQILKSSQDSDLAKVQITAADREFKRAQDAWNIHVIPERDFERARDDLETAKLNYAHAIETGGLEKDSLQLELRSQRATRDAQALLVSRLHERVDALTLKSPVAGIVATLAQVERAQIPENAPLVTVVDLSALEIEFQVAESYANEIRPGMNAEVTLDGRKLIGTVAGISPDVRNSQVTGRVRFASSPRACVRTSALRCASCSTNAMTFSRWHAVLSTIRTLDSSTWCRTTRPCARRWNSAPRPSAKSKSATDSRSAMSWCSPTCATSRTHPASSSATE